MTFAEHKKSSNLLRRLESTNASNANFVHDVHYVVSFTTAVAKHCSFWDQISGCFRRRGSTKF